MFESDDEEGWGGGGVGAYNKNAEHSVIKGYRTGVKHRYMYIEATTHTEREKM